MHLPVVCSPLFLHWAPGWSTQLAPVPRNGGAWEPPHVPSFTNKFFPSPSELGLNINERPFNQFKLSKHSLLLRKNGGVFFFLLPLLGELVTASLHYAFLAEEPTFSTAQDLFTCVLMQMWVLIFLFIPVFSPTNWCTMYAHVLTISHLLSPSHSQHTR